MYRCLAQLASPEVEELLLQAAMNATPGLRPTLIEALGSLTTQDPMPLLAQTMKSPLRAERQAVAKALGRRPRDAAAPLLLGLIGDTDADVACAAFDSIALSRNPDLVPALAERVAQLVDPAVRARLAAVVAVLGGPDARRLLAGMLSDHSPEVAAEAALGLTVHPKWSRSFQTSW